MKKVSDYWLQVFVIVSATFHAKHLWFEITQRKNNYHVAAYVLKANETFIQMNSTITSVYEITKENKRMIIGDKDNVQ